MITNINCIIIEDELPASILLEMHIAKFDFINLKGKFMSVSSAQKILNSQKIDLILLDINLPGISGIEFAKSMSRDISIIFTTAILEYAVEGFELEAVDYLLKPISFERFATAIQKYCKIQMTKSIIKDSLIKETERLFIFVKCERRMLKFFLDEICYFESKGNYLIIYTDNGTYITLQSLSQMDKQLPTGLFCRIHRSFLVSLKKIKQFNNSSVTILDKKLPIGRLYAANTHSTLDSIKKNIY